MSVISWGDIEPPPGATVYTHQLAGASIEELLEAAARDWWPNSQCEHEWFLLRDWAIQTESLMLDQAENQAWENAMRDLSRQTLPYRDWVAIRQRALDERTRLRRLAQGRLRDKYGFKRPRRWGLVARDVRELYERWVDA